MTIEKNKRKSIRNTDRHVVEFESNDIAATVWLREASGGVTYLDFTLHRSYRPKQKAKVCTSERYLARNREALHEVIDRAAEFVQRYQAHPELGLVAGREQMNGASRPGPSDDAGRSSAPAQDAA